MEENKILGLVVETISGSEYYEGKVVIDATGAATIFDRAGALCKTGENYLGYLTYIADFNKGVNQRIDLRSWDYSGSNMSGFGQPEDIGMLTGDSSDDVNVMMTKGQLLLLDKMKEDTNKEIVNVPAMPQFRMIKHMIGEYELNESDLFKHFEDSVGVVGNFLTRGEWLEIPMRSLINKDFPNLLPAGRIISAHGKAWNITRVIPAAVLTGEVSGIMASMAIDNNIDVKDIDVSKLQKKLVNVGIILHHE